MEHVLMFRMMGSVVGGTRISGWIVGGMIGEKGEEDGDGPVRRSPHQSGGRIYTTGLYTTGCQD